MFLVNINLVKDFIIFVGVRDYKFGDCFLWIDWKVIVWINNIMIKEFE